MTSSLTTEWACTAAASKTATTPTPIVDDSGAGATLRPTAPSSWLLIVIGAIGIAAWVSQRHAGTGAYLAVVGIGVVP